MALIRAPTKRFPKPIVLPIRVMTNTTMAAISTGSNHAYCSGKSIADLPSLFSDGGGRNDNRPSFSDATLGGIERQGYDNPETGNGLRKDIGQACCCHATSHRPTPVPGLIGDDRATQYSRDGCD